MQNDPYMNMPPGHVPPAGPPRPDVPPMYARARRRGLPRDRRAPLIAIGAGLLSLLLLLAVWYNRGTNRATRDLESAHALVIEKRRQVEEARQLLEQRIAELRAAQAQVAAGAERLDVEMVRERTTETEGGEVVSISGDPETRARESLQRGAAALQPQGAQPQAAPAYPPPAYPAVPERRP